MDIEDWLNRYTFSCQRLRARISPTQCTLNRLGTPDEEGLLVIIPACRECPDWILTKLAGTSPQPQAFDFWALEDPGRPRLPARFRPTALASSNGFTLTYAAVRRYGLRKFRSVRLFAAPGGCFVAQFIRRPARGADPDIHPVLRLEDGIRLAASGLVCASGAFGRYEIEGGNVPDPVLTLRPLDRPPLPPTPGDTQ